MLRIRQVNDILNGLSLAVSCDLSHFRVIVLTVNLTIIKYEVLVGTLHIIHGLAHVATSFG